MDWVYRPDFDSPACFAGLLGDDSHGRWLLCPAREPVRVDRGYRSETLVLETRFQDRCGQGDTWRPDTATIEGAP